MKKKKETLELQGSRLQHSPQNHSPGRRTNVKFLNFFFFLVVQK